MNRPVKAGVIYKLNGNSKFYEKKMNLKKSLLQRVTDGSAAVCARTITTGNVVRLLAGPGRRDHTILKTRKPSIEAGIRRNAICYNTWKEI